MDKFREHPSGFTLVELAIVIVIIGLLVGGVLQGQALIQAAKNNKIVTEFRSYLAGYITYKSKYNAIPGDDANAASYLGTCNADLYFWSTGCNGNGDKSYSSATGYDWGTNPDPGRFWYHMKYAKLISGEIKLGIQQYQLSAIGDSAVWWIYTGSYNTNHGAGPSTARQPLAAGVHYLTLANHISGVSNIVPVLSGDNAFSVDTKFDDGLSLTGKLLASTGSSSSVECVVGTDYNISNNAKSCVLIFQIE